MDAGQFQQFLQATKNADVKLRPFSSGDSVAWLTWRQHAESIIVLKEWDVNANTRTRARWAIRSAMTDHAGRAVADIDAAAVPNPDTCAAFLDLYQARFCPAAESRIAKAAFKSASQTEVETVLEWHVRIRSLYLRANPAQAGNVEHASDLIDRFVEGLRDRAVRVFAYDADPQTFAAALTSANNKTASNSVMGSTPGQPVRNPFLPKQEKDSGMFAMTTGDMECFFCREKGHIKPDCALWKKAKEQLLGPRDGVAQRGSRRGRGRGGRRPGPSRTTANNGRRGSSNRKEGRSINQVGDEDGNEEEQYEDPENC